MELTALVTQVDSVGAADLQVLTMWAAVSDLTKFISRTSTACSLSRILGVKTLHFSSSSLSFRGKMFTIDLQVYNAASGLLYEIESKRCVTQQC